MASVSTAVQLPVSTPSPGPRRRAAAVPGVVPLAPGENGRLKPPIRSASTAGPPPPGISWAAEAKSPRQTKRSASAAVVRPPSSARQQPPPRKASVTPSSGGIGFRSPSMPASSRRPSSSYSKSGAGFRSLLGRSGSVGWRARGKRDSAGSIGVVKIDEDENVPTSEEDEGHDIFAPTDERVQTIDFSRIRTQSIQLTKNEYRRKSNVLDSMKKQVKNFFHEDRPGQVTDEQGNVELPMNPCVQSRDDHDSGLLPSQKLFRLARHEQLQMRDRNLMHQKPGHYHADPGGSVDDYEFTWIVKRATKSAAPSTADGRRSRSDGGGGGFDAPDGLALQGGDEASDEGDETGKSHRTHGNTHRSKVGTNTIDFQERINSFLKKPAKQDSTCMRSEGHQEAQERARKAQLLSLCGLVAAPTLDALSTEEREMLEDFLREHQRDIMYDGDAPFPCDCCGPKAASEVGTRHPPAFYYDLLFPNRKNDSFTIRFDLVHCLPRFVLHYKFYRMLYDCLDGYEKVHLIKAATDIIMSYSLGHCTLQIPFGKYRTNAYPSFFAYIIVPEHARYLEIFEVTNPPTKPGERQKKNSCVIPNWPDKSYVTEFWTYSKESTSTCDKDPRLAANLYQKNVLRKLQLVQMPELLVTRKCAPRDVTSVRSKQSHRGDFELFEDFALVLHHEQPMLGFGSVRHPTHATDARATQPDIEFLDRLLQAMCAYVRRFINTRQRHLAGKEELSCTVNLSLHHSYAFKGHQRVYGFIGFPRASTYWGALVEEQRRNVALAEAAVTQEDIRRMRRKSEEASKKSEEASKKSTDEGIDEAGTNEEAESSVNQAALDDVVGKLQEKLNACRVL